MSMKILTEVWHDAPAQGGDLLVLLAIADAADDDHRMSWLSVPTIAKRARITERSVYRSLENLITAGMIENVDEADAPRAARGYSSAVRKVVELPFPETVRSTPDILSPLTPTSPNPSSTTAIGDIDLEELRSSGLTPAPFGRRRSRKTQPEAEQDPQSAVLASLEEDSQPRPRRQKATLTDPSLPRSRTRRISGAGNLARLFTTLAKVKPSPVPGATNTEALRGSIQRWMNDGTDYSLIVSMIETYWSDTFESQRSTSKPAWQDFLAQRGHLFALTYKETEAQAVEADRHDPSAWGGKVAPRNHHEEDQ